jgi:hypothetical protein
MDTEKDQISFLIEKIHENGSFTSWHWNEPFLEFCDKFYPEQSIKYCRTKLSYYMKKLYDNCFVKKSIKTGIGEGGKSLYGVSYQTTWRKSDVFDINYRIFKTDRSIFKF